MLTKKQKLFLDGLKKMVMEREYFPSVREIGGELGFSSPATVHAYLNKLLAEDKITRGQNGWSIKSEANTIPLMGYVPDGSSFEVFEDLGEEVEIPEWMMSRAGELHALRVVGDSMKDAYIQEGDIVIIKKCLQAESNEMVIAIMEDHSITLKRLKKDGQKAWLVPENPDYKPIFDPFRIAGKVISVLRRYI